MRLLKLDSIHPLDYLLHKQQEWKPDIADLTRKAYYDRIIALRCNFSDFYTYNLNRLGWQSEEFFINDWMYVYKLAKELYGSTYKFKRLVHQLRNRAGLIEPEWRLKVLKDYIDAYKPDVIFCREHTNIPGSFWKQYRKKIFLVSRLSAHLPAEWSPLDFDLIYTDVPYYRTFFEFNKIETLHNYNGFDERILNELTKNKEPYDVVFIGGLGNELFQQRTRFFTDLAADDQFGFKWWGYSTGTIEQPLTDAYQGLAAGLAMFNIYYNSKIVVNDYIDIAGGTAVNQRLFEVMGAGSLLLTRESPSLVEHFPPGSYVTYKNLEECKGKISYYLRNEDERKQIAALGQAAVLAKYSYAKLMQLISEDLTTRVTKFKQLKKN
ncbi:glycosyltransferase [Lacibacter sp.]|uniref:glycosyltransferase n=1 Tax=Lacibacter sp. TaxID=1915409 RepID=UPI002B4B42F7|nr:glycosyltransferase [Lacibacter sp.]HLP36109.1 glycosyltransferase [Lacibacter sp.]